MAELLQITEPDETPLPHARDTSVAIGIDLGTTNSVVAISTEGTVEVLRDPDGGTLVPSVVAYAADGSAVVGELARRVLIDQPEVVVSSVKRLMGRGAEDVARVAGTLAHEIETPDADAEAGGMVRLSVGGRRLSPVEVSAEILKAMKARAEDHLGQVVERAVITVPAYFDDAARAATKDAARLAGLEVLRLVNEPTAAALAYGLDEGAEGTYAVYDLGGGTFDISLLRMEKGVFQVLATGGDSALGGDDFDRAVAEHFVAERAAQRGEEALSVSAVKGAMMSARLAKECLTKQREGSWVLDFNDVQSSHRLDRDELERLIEPLVTGTIRACRDVVGDARLRPGDIDGVVLVGGSTRVPLVRRRVAEFFGREPLAHINPDEVVAVGAALQAEALTRGSDTLLLDVTPLSLGIETMGGLVEKIIPRNTPIPVAKAQEFTTFQDGQPAMSIHVVQGEREMVGQCRSLARFVLDGIPPMVAGAARVRVSFAVDADGLLTVSATEQTTGVQQRVEVKPSYGLTEAEMATMLRDSMRHAKDDMTRRLLAEARVDAERVAGAVTPALASDPDLVSEDERAAIERAIDGLRDAAAGEDRDAIASAIETLEATTRAFAERRMDRGIRSALTGRQIGDIDAVSRPPSTDGVAALRK